MHLHQTMAQRHFKRTSNLFETISQIGCKMTQSSETFTHIEILGIANTLNKQK
jgi:hypothetical protein